ncbi:Piso0_000497 [Millerozyma farinosa CBS 7064]|uniref:Piso0_000497 protein n=1 Tax=Pichia sorbitophila (strain ATCC MYA-4447 / BCRC 22081 / CBS 7064 / NBRC 10061 / NRRL Y-12695) TaxID=559304 RepID=G8YU55_PICSO|nr:Piso0_000497 [Millerozyma farinosa CBS 7064]CCE73456.1 Piso0_000497 [Millerozyma farinosa CBS 7064]
MSAPANPEPARMAGSGSVLAASSAVSVRIHRHLRSYKTDPAAEEVVLFKVAPSGGATFAAQSRQYPSFPHVWRYSTLAARKSRMSLLPLRPEATRLASDAGVYCFRSPWPPLIPPAFRSLQDKSTARSEHKSHRRAPHIPVKVDPARG